MKKYFQFNILSLSVLVILLGITTTIKTNQSVIEWNFGASDSNNQSIGRSDIGMNYSYNGNYIFNKYTENYTVESKYFFDKRKSFGAYKLLNPTKELVDYFVQFHDKNKEPIQIESKKLLNKHGDWTIQFINTSANLITGSIVNENVAWIGGFSGVVFRTTNGGTNWIKVTNLPGDVINIFGINQDTSFTCVNLNDDGRVYRTTNGGIQWDLVIRYTGVSASIINVYFFNDSNGVAIGNPVNGLMRIFSTQDYGLTWDTISKIPINGEIYRDAVNWLTNKIGWFGTSEGYVYFTSNGGLNWSSYNLGSLDVFSLAFVNNKLGLASTAFRQAYKTTNGGESWLFSSVIPAPDPFNLISFIVGVEVPTPRFWAASLDVIYISTDYGESWDYEVTLSGYPFNDILMKYIRESNKIIGYAICANQFLLKYSEVLTSGNIIQVEVSNRWNILSVPMLVNDYQTTEIYPTAISKACTYSNENYILEDTLRKGVGYWLKFDDNQTVAIFGVPISIDTFNVNEGWNMIGSISEPVLTSNIFSIPPGVVTSNFYKYDGKYIICDTIYPGKGYWVKVNQTAKLILSSSVYANESNRIRIIPIQEMPPSLPESDNLSPYIPDRFVLEQNYPNPFNSSTKIRYGIPEASFVTIKLYNMIGKEIITLVKEVKEAGMYEIDLDAKGITSGIYFYRMRAGSFVEAKKLILLR